MPVQALVRPGEYHDSVTLMALARELARLPGVRDAAVVMGTPANKAILSDAGLATPEVSAAAANDLLIVVAAESSAAAAEALRAAAEMLQAAGGALTRRESAAGPATGATPRSIRTAVRLRPEARVAVISVAGQYAAAEAWDALQVGLHVLLFSDNVPLADEIDLKHHARQRGLLLMGPGCGTAILDGVALGFANAVPRGPVGIVAAAGTGLQEVSTLLARLGTGVSQAIGTGGRDLGDEVGGLTAEAGIQRLLADAGTGVIVLVAKQPSLPVVQGLLRQVRGAKPVIACCLGVDPAALAATGALPAATLQEAVALAAAVVHGRPPSWAGESIQRETAELRARAARWHGRQRLAPGQTDVRGLFSGGTLATEAWLLWREMLGQVRSNVALDLALRLDDVSRCAGHCVLDLGDEAFTVGRPHPMIDYDLRVRRLLHEATDPAVLVLTLDVVLGYGAHPDPAAELAPAIRQARERAAAAGRALAVILSLTGTDADPQGLDRQRQALEAAGAMVAGCNAAAARLAAFIVKELP